MVWIFSGIAQCDFIMEGESKSVDPGRMFQGTFFMTQEDRRHTQTGMHAGGVPLLL